MKAFCFLPLPIETRLPVHINGHFALDEARRNLWRDEGGGYRSDWNNALLAKVIAPCYVALLAGMRQHLHLPLGSDGTTVLEEEVPRSQIDDYWALFPSLELNDPYWSTLSEEIYRYVAHHKVPLLPVQRSLHTGPLESEAKGQWEFVWLPPLGEGRSEVFFNSLNEDNPSGCFSSFAVDPSKGRVDTRKGESLRSILLSAGMNVVDAPLRIHKNFLESGADVVVVTPQAVLTFFGTYSCQPHGRLQNLPQRVEDTPLKHVESVLSVLNYCKRDWKFYELLQGLPLLVTEDRTLRKFDCSSQSFLTKHVDVLPQCASEFVHRSFVDTVFPHMDAGTRAVFKVFDVSAMADRLSWALPDAYFCRTYVEWNPVGLPSPTWIAHVWNFLREAVLKNSNLGEGLDSEVTEELRPLNNWCLLPVTEPLNTNPRVTREYLAPIKMADTVVDFSFRRAVPVAAGEALRKLRLPELNCQAIKESLRLARILVGSLENPLRILRSLSRKLTVSSLEGVLSEDECDAILQYYERHLVSRVLTWEWDDVNVLKELPFYRSVTDDLINLSGKTAYIPEDFVLAAGLGSCLSSTGVVFLRRNFQLQNLHKSLGCHPIGEVEFYVKFVLPNFGKLERDDQLAHLERVRKLLQQCSTQKKDQLLSSLKTIPILPGEDGSLQVASHFYDPQERVFKAMFPESKFPPEPFSSDKWLAFLRQIGLVRQVTQHHFVTYAKEVAKDGLSGGNPDTLTKSEALIAHLFERPNLAWEGLLEQIRCIAFVHPHRVPESLGRIQQQFGMRSDGALPYICFEGAVRQDQEHIAWTSANLLPDDADPSNVLPKDKGAIIQKLGILEEPTVKQVVSHCKQVFPKVPLVSENGEDCNERIVKGIYAFLEDHRTHEEVLKLCEFRCVLVEDNKRQVLPRQIVIELMSEQEIWPHLYKLPTTFGPFEDLFVALGCTRTASFGQYAAVLKAIYEETGARELKKVEKDSAFKAVKGLFESLEKDGEQEITADSLLLPGATKDDPTRFFLLRSADLVYDNAPQFRGQVRGFEEKLLVDLKECGLKAVNFEVLVDMLPEALKPKKLTSLVQECRSGSSSLSMLRGKAEELRQLLKSQSFSRAIVRLIRHEDYAVGRTTEPDILQSVQRNLNGIQVRGVDVLKTHLSYQGRMIPQSEVQKTCFAEKTSTENGQVWTVYLDTSGSGRHEKTWISQVANIVNEITGGRLQATLVYLPGLLTCASHEIWAHLDTLAIRQDETFDPGQTACLVQPGDFVSIADHWMLRNEFEDLTAGEVVGYEISDQSLVSKDETPVYIYAMIIEEVTPGQPISCLTKRYKIDVGNDEDPRDVDVVDLYKVRQTAPRREGDDGAPVGPLDFEEEIRKATELLQQAWTFPKKKRDKIIKRLYLTWHPTKNPGNEEFCSKIAEFLRSKIREMESGKSGAAQGESNGGYSSHFENLDWRAHQQRRQEMQGTREGHRPNPQPDQAKRWLRQATADFRAAGSDFSAAEPSYEWVCFKCHQAAEKALKAAQYSEDATRTNRHELGVIAGPLNNAELSSLASDLESLLGGSARMRYPDRTCYPEIPHDVYDHAKAAEARDLAERILHEAGNYIESRARVGKHDDSS